MPLARPYERHAFVCTTGEWCKGLPIQKLLKQGVKEAGLRDEIRVNQSGCLNQCGRGPMMVVYPEGVWYHALTEEKARRILQSHLVGPAPVEELRYFPERAGNNKTPEVSAAEKARKALGPKAEE